ncbi:F0F1 ATP synthase subunit epsilon [bacterium]|nr:F0F1 ATP synthase subunit epsilon [bacterium]
MADFHLQIVTRQQAVFDEPVTALTLPGEDGYFGILAHHAPIVSVLKEGDAVLRQGTREQTIHIEGGFLEMSHNRATLLCHGLQGLQAAAAASEDE